MAETAFKTTIQHRANGHALKPLDQTWSVLASCELKSRRFLNVP
jgi:hypothetical protein